MYEKAKVLEVYSEELAPDPEVPSISIGKQQLKPQILTGEYKGKEIVLLLIVLFVIVVFGKMKGFKSIFSLAFTLICVNFQVFHKMKSNEKYVLYY